MAKVLVAEDEQPIRIVLADTLLDAGYDVIEATDGGAAFEKACLEHPDIILLDVMMPVMDGFGVLKRLRETPSTEAIPVVLLTAVPAAEGERAGSQLGVQHYITKPWTPDTLELTLKVALRSAALESDNGVDDSRA